MPFTRIYKVIKISNKKLAGKKSLAPKKCKTFVYIYKRDSPEAKVIQKYSNANGMFLRISMTGLTLFMFYRYLIQSDIFV